MMTFIEPGWLTALAAVPAAALLLVVAAWQRSRLLARFVGPAAASRYQPRSLPRRLIKVACFLLALAAVSLALARPGTSPVPQKIQRSGRDVVVLLDVSRSMLATDLRPSRLDRAKLIIRDMLDVARGDRIAVIAFAGSTVVRCPLTTDYGFARLSLDSITPDIVARGGTLIGDAIRSALADIFTDADDRYRDIILITDGEDHESLPLEAAKAAGSRGVRIIAIGLGSELEGSTIPADPSRQSPDAAAEVQTYQGEQVRTRMNAASLRDIADASNNGVFLNVGTGTIQMDKIYPSLIERAERRDLDSAERVKYTELFQFLLAAAIALLFIEPFFRERSHRDPRHL